MGYILILFFLLAINIFIHKRRIVIVNKLYALYDKMENEVITKKLKIDKKLITFLKIHKNTIYNNHLLDFHILFKNYNEVIDDKDFEKRKEAFYNYLESLPNELQELSLKIDKLQNKVINLSILKPMNLLRFTFLLIISLVGISIYCIIKPFGLVIKQLIRTPKLIRGLYDDNESITVSYNETKLYTS